MTTTGRPPICLPVMSKDKQNDFLKTFEKLSPLLSVSGVFCFFLVSFIHDSLSFIFRQSFSFSFSSRSFGPSVRPSRCDTRRMLFVRRSKTDRFSFPPSFCKTKRVEIHSTLRWENKLLLLLLLLLLLTTLRTEGLKYQNWVLPHLEDFFRGKK